MSPALRIVRRSCGFDRHVLQPITVKPQWTIRVADIHIDDVRALARMIHQELQGHAPMKGGQP